MASCPDVAPECATIEIPDHRHEVVVELSRLEISGTFAVSDKTQLVARLPWEQKSVDVTYTTLDGAPFDPPYGDIHHRDETLRGIADAEILATIAPVIFGGKGPDLLLSAGLTIPLGHIEPNPVVAGREGIEHEHLQFGTGTFDPRLILTLSYPVGRVLLAGNLDARIPLYENRYGFKPPVSLVWSVGPVISLGTGGLAAFLAGQSQSIGKWDGEIDEGTGFSTVGWRVRGTIPLGKDLLAIPSVYGELSSEGHVEGEAFHQGTTWSIVLSRTFR